jgi:hypothetical protein
MCPADSDYHNDFIGRTRIVWLEHAFSEVWDTVRYVDGDHPEHNGDESGGYIFIIGETH